MVGEGLTNAIAQGIDLISEFTNGTIASVNTTSEAPEPEGLSMFNTVEGKVKVEAGKCGLGEEYSGTYIRQYKIGDQNWLNVYSYTNFLRHQNDFIFLAFLLKPLVDETEIEWTEIFAFDNNGTRDVYVSVSYMEGLTTTQEDISEYELTVKFQGSKYLINGHFWYYVPSTKRWYIIFFQNTLSAAVKMNFGGFFDLSTKLEASVRASLMTKNSTEESNSIKNKFGLTVGAGKLVRIRQAIIKFKSARGELFEIRPRHFDVISEEDFDCIEEDQESSPEDDTGNSYESDDQFEFEIIDGFLENDLYTFTAVGEGDIKFQKLINDEKIDLKAPTNLKYVTDDMLWELRNAKKVDDEEQSWFISDDEQGLQLAIIESSCNLNMAGCELSLAANNTLGNNAKWIITEMVKQNATNPAEYKIQNKMYPNYYLVQITHGEEWFSAGISNDTSIENVSHHWRIESQFTEPTMEWVEIMNVDNTDGKLSFRQNVTLKTGVISESSLAETKTNVVSVLRVHLNLRHFFKSQFKPTF